MADVFLSYARADEAVARRVAKALQAAGLEVWWDADLPAHRAYSDVIERNLADARAVVVLWSAASAKSQWVRAEADVARNSGKLVQAQLDGALPPLPFNQIQCANLNRWKGGAAHHGWAKVRSSVQALVSGEEIPACGFARQSIWDRVKPYRWWAAALALLIVATAVFYTVGWPGEDRKPVLAVLPFRSLDTQDASLVAGMWEDTRTAIGRNPQLVVLGPNTAQALAGKGEGAARKAADYLVQASVRRAGNRIRVSADLVRTKDGEQLWSQDFDRKLDDVFALQSQIAGEIEGRIRGRLAKKGGTIPEHIATSGEVYALYADARAKIGKREFDSFATAARELQQVLRIDPNFAPAWAALAFVADSVPPSQRDWDPTSLAEAYARKAIELAPNLAAGHAALAFALDLRGPVATAEIERAVQLDPNDYQALTWLGNLRSTAGDKRNAIEAYRRAAEIEPYFWPAVFNLYGALKEIGDERGVQQLLEQEKRLGADYLGTAIEVDDAYAKGNIAQAVNAGLAYWKTGQREGRTPISVVLWPALLQLGFLDEADRLSPAPEFAPKLWRNDPAGLDEMMTGGLNAKRFFMFAPLTENASRVYLLSRRSSELSNMYLSLKLAPEEFQKMVSQDDPEHFLYSAPLIALALKQNGHDQEARALLSLAEARAKRSLKSAEDSAVLARIYAVEGRKGDAAALLASAVDRGWIPAPPAVLVDLDLDPALASLKADPRFQRARQQILTTVARERAKVDPRLLAQLSKA